MKSYIKAAISAAALMASTAAFAGPEAEVLHWWTSGGEAKSVAVLQAEFAENGSPIAFLEGGILAWEGEGYRLVRPS